MDVDLVKRPEEISRIAYGFMASKALFAALHLDLFTHVASGHCTLDALAGATGARPTSHLRTLLAALESLGLLARDGDSWRNSPGAERFLVRGAKNDIGDYYRYQLDEQIYEHFTHLRAGLRGEPRAATAGLGEWLTDPSAAEKFSRSQHAGSLGPAAVLAATVDLSDRRHLLDVGGGSGAFSIRLCQANPHLRATILDVPAVVDTATRFIREGGLAGRIDTVGGDCLDVEWPDGMDVILMSYLLSALPGDRIPEVLVKARESLTAEGLLIIHDFMLDDDGVGPTSAALWFLAYVTNSTGTVAFTVPEITEAVADAGFGDITRRSLISEITTVVTATRP